MAAEHMALNIPFLLHHHLNHADNSGVISDLFEIESKNRDASITRLLKLLTFSLFNTAAFNDRSRIGVGRFGKVYECKMLSSENSKVALKLFDMPRTIYEDSIIFDVFIEVTCLEKMYGQKDGLKLYDYGVSKDSYWMVIQYFSQSLCSWRNSLGNINLSDNVHKKNLQITFDILLRVVDSLSLLHNSNIVHFDIKGDNILVTFKDDEINLAIADFGQSIIYAQGTILCAFFTYNR